MTIPGRGDLSPRRRSSYGRRRRRWPRVLAVLVVLAAVGAGGYYGWHRLRTDNGTSTAALQPCPTASPLPSLTAPQVAGPPIRVLNGNLRAGLAARVARQLHQRFHIEVLRVGNAARFIRGASEVRYPAQLQQQAVHVAAGLVPAPTLQLVAVARVEVDLGTKFRRVATPAEYATALRALLAQYPGASPSPSPTPTPTATPSPCRSR